MSTFNSEERYSQIEKLFKNLACTHNPSGEESNLMLVIKTFLLEHQLIDYSTRNFLLYDTQIGMIFKCTFDDQEIMNNQENFSSDIVHDDDDENSKPSSICLFAHLDSDHIESEQETLKELVWRRDDDEKLCYSNGDEQVVEVGLDDKSGICVILETLLRLKEMKGIRVSVYVCFSVQEETGQKGVMRLNHSMFKSMIENGGVSCGIAIDRMSCYHPENKRHLVDEYCRIPLIPNTQKESFMNQFNKTSQLVEGCDIDFIPSDNCSDLLEYKIKLDCEIVAPQMLNTLNTLDVKLFEKLSTLLEKYESITSEILQIMGNISATSRVSGFKSHPRCTRYQLAHQINSLIYSEKVLEFYKESSLKKYLNISFVNLSLDYDDSCGFICLKELDKTAEILVDFIRNYHQ